MLTKNFYSSILWIVSSSKIECFFLYSCSEHLYNFQVIFFIMSRGEWITYLDGANMSFWNWNFISHFRIIPINLFSFHSNIRLGLIFLFDILFPKPYLHLDVRDFQNDVCFLQFDERNLSSIFFGLRRGLGAKSARVRIQGDWEKKPKIPHASISWTHVRTYELLAFSPKHVFARTSSVCTAQSYSFCATPTWIVFVHDIPLHRNAKYKAI